MAPRLFVIRHSMNLNLKNSLVIFCGFSLATAAATAAYGQGPVLPIEPMPAAATAKNTVSAIDLTTQAEINEREYLRRAAGLTALHGPGIVVTLRDRKGIKSKDASQSIPGLVHDYDLSAVVNQLRAADAEAIAINGIRVGSQTAITVSGSSIYIGGQRIGNPFEIEAIGDAGQMKNRLEASGIASELKNVGPYISVATSKNLRVPALKEAPQFRFGKPE